MSKPFCKAYFDGNGNIQFGWFINELGLDIPLPVLDHAANGRGHRSWKTKEKYRKELKDLRRSRGKAGGKDKDGKRRGAKKRVDKLEPPLDDGYRMKTSFVRPYFSKKEKRQQHKFQELELQYLKEEFGTCVFIYWLKDMKNNFVGRRKRSKRNKGKVIGIN